MMAYDYIKAFHIISLIAWLAGLFYLPRLFAYHVASPVGSPQAEIFKIMERRLLRAIINPAMIATLLFGGILVYLQPTWLQMGWLHAKLACVAGLIVFHSFCARWRKQLACDRYTHSNKFYRMMNELPTVLMVAIVILATVKPF
jgi:protoporphyrinogen IX oxidase